MGMFDSAVRGIADREEDTGQRQSVGATAQVTSKRETTVTAGGEEVQVQQPETQQPDESGTWLTGTDSYGRPRGADALERRQIVQTSAMQSIVNGIAGQVLGGDLTSEANDEAMQALSPAEQDAVGDLRTLVMDILSGPHLPNLSLDQLVVAAVEDMVGPGQAVWQLLRPAEGQDTNLPVVAMQTLDPLTVRINIDKNNIFGDPPYWQATGAFSGGSVSTLGSVDPVPLQQEDIAVMDYPYGTRSYKTYPVSPAYQVKEWLEILANSTTHHNRYYNDDELPPGLLQVVNASDQTIQDVKEKLEAARGDPRSVPVVGGEGGAQWMEMGGTAINLNVIEEQKWFYQLCLGALGLGKAEVGLIEDVNRSNGEVEATRVYKRVAGPFINQFEHAFRKVAEQFDLYQSLGRPFTPTLTHSDPREERAKEERLRKQLDAGAITPRQYARRVGDTDIAEDDDRWQVTINGETVDYGDHPTWVTKRLMSSLSDGVADPDAPAMPADGESETDGEEA